MTAKTPSQGLRQSKRAFSLIELLIVIALIAMLAGMVLAAAGGIQNNMVKKRTIALLAEIEGGLDDYKIDHGTYPINEAEDRNESAKKGANILYKHLSGDYDLNGEFDVADNEAKIYVDSLDFKSSARANKGTVMLAANGDYVAVDSYGNLIRYLCDPPNRIVGNKVEKRTLNPTYDLWSLGGAPPDNDEPESRAKWITNWGAQ